MSNRQGGGGVQNLPPLSEQTIRQLTENQARDLVLRAEELALRKQNDNNQCEVAKLAIKANAEDREKSRSTTVALRKHRFIFWGFIVVVSLVFIGALLYMGKDPIVSEIIKAAVYLGAGGIAGYYGGKNKKDKPD